MSTENILEETESAYSFDRYGEEEWLKCIEFMEQSNFKENEAIWVLRSKHMRWNADGCGDNDNVDFSEHFKDYLYQNANGVLDDLLAEGFDTDVDFSEYQEELSAESFEEETVEMSFDDTDAMRLRTYIQKSDIDEMDAVKLEGVADRLEFLEKFWAYAPDYMKKKFQDDLVESDMELVIAEDETPVTPSVSTPRP